MFTHICQSNPEKQLHELLRTVLCSHIYWSCCEEIRNIHPSLSKLELVWSNQPQLKDPACRNWRSGIQCAAAKTRHSQTNKIFSKKSSKSAKNVSSFGKRKHKRILRLHNNNKIVSFPIYENIVFLKNNSLFPQKSHPWGNSFQECGQQPSHSLSHCIPKGLGCSYVDITHRGVLLSTATGPECMFWDSVLWELLLFPSLA